METLKEVATNGLGDLLDYINEHCPELSYTLNETFYEIQIEIYQDNEYLYSFRFDKHGNLKIGYKI